MCLKAKLDKIFSLNTKISDLFKYPTVGTQCKLVIQNEEAMTAKRIVAEWANLFDIRAFDEKQKSGTC